MVNGLVSVIIRPIPSIYFTYSNHYQYLIVQFIKVQNIDSIF